MRCRNKANSMRVVLRFTVGLILGLFVLGIGNIQYVEGSSWHKGRFHKAESLSCGEMITTHAVLYDDLDCSNVDGVSITLGEGASLDLNGQKVIGNSNENCIEITGDGAEVRNGTVTHCDYGIRVRSNLNKITNVKVSDCASRGFRIDGDENLLKKCVATQNANQGIVIKGNDNKIFSCEVRDNCRDGIEIDKGTEGNLVYYNDVENNGNLQTCEHFGLGGDNYKPWNYAGIDVVSPSQNNEIKHNRACGNRGCFGTDDSPCTAYERNFWDENSLNQWDFNSITCRNVKPKFNGFSPH